MKYINEYKTTGEWFRDARAEGYRFPLSMCQGLDVGQRELKLSFSEVFELFVKHRIIIDVGGSYVYNLQGHLAIRKDG